MGSRNGKNQQAQSVEQDDHDDSDIGYRRKPGDTIHTQEYVFAAVATGIIWTAVLNDKECIKKMDRYGRLGQEFKVFHKKHYPEYYEKRGKKNGRKRKPVPEEVKKWVRENCGPNGDATEAIKEQLEFVMKTIRERNLEAGSSDCWPFCHP